MTAIASGLAPRSGLLRGPGFDSVFIGGSAGLAIGVGFALGLQPGLFGVIVLPYLWLLGYPHLMATFTRTAFDRESRRQYRRVNVELFVAILALCAALATGVGTIALVTIYLYWQWFHFTRQSWGVSRFYARKGGFVDRDERLTRAVIYAVPIFGILHRSWQAPETYLGARLWVIPVPDLVLLAAGIATLMLVAAWSLRQVQALREGSASLAHSAYVASHVVMFTVGYVLIDSIDHGWLALSIWHTLQYLLFVWMFQVNRFKGGIDPARPLLSSISQKGRGWRFYLNCAGLAAVVVAAINLALSSLAWLALPLTLVVYSAINFHHYTLDALVWRSPRR